MAAAVTKAAFGKLPDGTAIDIYTLKNAELTVRITNYGARIVSLATKDRDGKMGDVVLGYDSVEGYVAEEVSKTYLARSWGGTATGSATGSSASTDTSTRFR